MAKRSGDWDCPRCGAVGNYRWRNTCYKGCGTRKPANGSGFGEPSATSSNPDVSMKRKRKDDHSHRGQKKKSSSDGAEVNDIIEIGDSDEDSSEVAPVPDTARRTTRSAAVLPDPFKVQ